MRANTIAAALIFSLCSTAAYIAAGAEAQFPTRSVRLIVPTASSGATDFVGRVLALGLGIRWGHNVVVDNRAGATGLIGLEIVARSAPDGYTLLVISTTHLMVGENSDRLSFGRNRDFTAISHSAASPFVLVVHPSTSAKSVKELVELARAKPRELNYASSGVGGLGHLAVELFDSMAKIEMTHIPYQGLAAAFPDLLSGRVQLAMSPIASAIQPIQTGRLYGLAVTGPNRASTLPQVPTFAEAGYPNYDTSFWYGIFGPAHMPALLVAKLNADFNRIVHEPDVTSRFVSGGNDVTGNMTSAQFTDYVAKETVKWNDAYKAAGMR